MFSPKSYFIAQKNKPNQIIWTVDGLCGQGKSFNSAKMIADHWWERRVLFVTPTVRLANEIAATLDSMSVRFALINSTTTDGNVEGEVIRALRYAPDGTILLITWETFSRLDRDHYYSKWRVIIDEIPPVDLYRDYRIPRSTHVFREWFDVKRTTAKVYQLVLKDIEQAKRLLKERDDLDMLADKDFRKLVKHLAYGRYDAYVFAVQWERLVEIGEFTKISAETQTLGVLQMLNPFTLADSCLLGANIDRSLLKHWVENYAAEGYPKFKMINEPVISAMLRPEQDLSKRAEINYLLNGFNAKKTTFGDTTRTDVSVLTEMERQVSDFFGDEEFLFVKNKEVPSTLDENPNVVPLPWRSNGLNDFQKHTNIAILAACNRTRQRIHLIKALGVPEELIPRNTHEDMYQQVMRTALRNPGSDAIVRVVMPDEASALYLADVLGCPKIGKLGDIPTKQKDIPLPPEDRKKRAVFRKIRKSLLKVSFEGTATDDESDVANRHKVFFTAHGTEKTDDPDDHHPQQRDIQDFIQMLRASAASAWRTKKDDEGYLINPCLFEPEITGSGYRTKANFFAASFAVLDFDDGPVTPDDVVMALHYDAGRGRKLPFVICNSFSRSLEKPNRFRLFVFYKREAVSLAQHQAAIQDVVTQLEDAGLATRESLDRQSMSGVQSFYMPCANFDHQEAAFFECFNTKSAEIARHGLDPQTLVAYAKKPEFKQRSFKLQVRQEIDWKAVESEVAKVRAMTEDRHHILFDLTHKLRKMGLDDQMCLEQLLSISNEPHIVKKVKTNVAKVYGWRK